MEAELRLMQVPERGRAEFVWDAEESQVVLWFFLEGIPARGLPLPQLGASFFEDGQFWPGADRITEALNETNS